MSPTENCQLLQENRFIIDKLLALIPYTRYARKKNSDEYPLILRAQTEGEKEVSHLTTL